MIVLYLLMLVYVLGWAFTAYIFWQYAAKNGKYGALRPIPAALFLAIFWPFIFSLSIFAVSKES